MSSDLTFVTNGPGKTLRDRFGILLGHGTRYFDYQRFLRNFQRRTNMRTMPQIFDNIELKLLQGLQGVLPAATASSFCARIIIGDLGANDA